eukprot:COSAG05_NODE_1492_length_4716_cov_20.157895_3_plen_89_part_00
MRETGNWECSIDFLEAVGLLFGLRMALVICSGRGRLICYIDNEAVCGMLHKLSSPSPTCLAVMPLASRRRPPHVAFSAQKTPHGETPF